LALAEVAAADLDITVVGQLSAPQLALDDQLEPGPVQVVRFKTFLGRHDAVDEAPEDISRYPDHALVLTDADPELDGPEVRVPPRILRKAEEHGSARSMWVPVSFRSENAPNAA
jgi:hypothetical protein